HHCGDDRLDCELLKSVADANRRWGTQTGLGHAETIEQWLALTPIERAASLKDLRKVVLTDKGTPRVSAGQLKAEPHYDSHAGRLAVPIAAQWEIIERLVDEYFSGSSEAEQRTRTLFMVGDLKQAIYGFQGTDPARFSEAREMFKRRAASMSSGDDLFNYRQSAQEFRD